MSLIFKALQRFQQPGVASGDQSKEMAPQSSGLAFRKIFLAPTFLLGVAIIVGAVGFIFFHGMTQWSGKGKQMTPMAEAAPSGKTVVTQKVRSEDRAMDEISEPNPSQQPPVGADPEVTYQFHTPEDNHQKVLAGSAFIKKDQPQYELTQWPAKPTVIPAQSSDGTVSANAATARPSFIAAEDTAGPKIDEAGSGERLGRQAALSPLMGQSAFFSPTPTALGEAQTAPIKKSANDPQNHLKPIMKQQRQASRATRHLRIARLVQEIHSAVRTDDRKRVSSLLNKLVQMKGPNDPFVSKLKAYSFIQQSRLEEARSLLTGVLSLNADDLEAGLNMAVIDIKTGQYKEARIRLVGLQAIYPEQDQIATYLRQLSR